MFSNYFIITSPDLFQIETILFNFELFNLFAVGWWLQIQGQLVNNLNRTISEEFNKEINLDILIGKRKDINKQIFLFERYKSELNLLNFIEDTKTFLVNMEGDKRDFHRHLVERIENQIKIIEKLINTYNKHLDISLNFENIKYNKKMQDKVHSLTWIVISLAVLQVFFIFIQIWLYIYYVK